MSKTYIANAFSPAMLSALPATLRAEAVDDFPRDAISAVGHADTAAVLGVAHARINVSLEDGDVVYVAQLQGGRLPEGAHQLPAGFSFKFIKISVSYA
jgi:hypothetical protein